MGEAESTLNKPYHHGDLKKALLEETARILREEGEGALSLRGLAARLGVSRTAPYNHYKNKESLLSAVAEEGFRRFNVAIDKVEKSKRYPDGRSLMRAHWLHVRWIYKLVNMVKLLRSARYRTVTSLKI